MDQILLTEIHYKNLPQYTVTYKKLSRKASDSATKT